MSKKRFTDVDKWRDPWFRALSPSTKLFWGYLCDRCDDAGVWVVDPAAFEFESGDEAHLEQRLIDLGDRVQVIGGGAKWLLTKFIQFQYPNGLSADSKPQRAVLKLIERHNMIIPTKESPNSMETVRSTVQDKDKDTDKDRDSNARATPPTTPLPLAHTKPGVMELRAIPGLKITQDSLPAWLALAEQVGLKVIEAARDELVLAGKDCWQPEVSTVALRLHAKAKRSVADARGQVAQRSQASERAALLEETRLLQREEAIQFLNLLSASGFEPDCDQALLAEVRKGIAFGRPGTPPIGGPFSALAKLRSWFETAKATPPTERTA